MAHGDDEQDRGGDAPVGPRRSNYTPPPGGFRWFGRPADDDARADDGPPPVPTSLPSEAEEGMAARLSEQLGELTARLAAERDPGDEAQSPAPYSPWAEQPATASPVYPWDQAAEAAEGADPDRPWAMSPSLPPAGPGSAQEPAPMPLSSAEPAGSQQSDPLEPAPEQLDAEHPVSEESGSEEPVGAPAQDAPADDAPGAPDARVEVVEFTPTGSLVLPPSRSSLSDDELLAALGTTSEGGTLAAIERFQEQLRLREQDTAQFTAWERDVLAEGTSEAFDAVERVRGGFAGLVPPTTAAITLPPQPTSTPSSAAEPEPVDPEAEGAEAGAAEIAEAGIVESEVTEPEASEPEAEFAEPDPEVLESEIADAETGEVADAETGEFADAETGEFAEPVEPEIVEHDAPEPTALVLHPRLDWQGASAEPETVEGEIVEEEPALPAWPAAGDGTAAPEAASTELERIDPAQAPAPLGTAVVPLIQPGYEPEPEDHAETVDDREPLARPIDADGAALDTAPVSSVLAAQDIEELLQPEPVRPLPLFSLEASGLEPTPEEQRAGRAIRLFWLWFAPQSSVIGLGVGALLLLGGLDLPQALLAAVAGALLGVVPLSLGTLAAARTGQPTIVASRAVFGVLGNVLPAALSLISRLVWGAVLLWVIGLGTSSVLVGQGLTGPLGDEQVSILAVAFAFLIALIVAFAGYGLLHGVHLVLSALSALLLAGTIALTWPLVDLQTALALPQGSGTAVLSGTALVLSFTGLAWAFSGGDVARYQRPGGSGTAAVAATGLASLLPTVGLLGYGALLGASDPELAASLAANPAAALAELLPGWYAVPLVLAMAGSLLAGLVLVIYSAAFSVQAAGLAVQRQSAVVFVGLLLAIGAVALILAVPDLRTSIEDLVGTIAVPVAAWAGIFAGDLVLRSRALDGDDLLRTGGRYPSFVWGNVAALVLLTALGFGLRSAELGALAWQGYLQQPLAALGVPVIDAVASGGGVIVALLLGLVWSLATAAPRIRRQQSAVDA
ncbi:MAG: cytosine permease [Microbacteriaceae bacterium]